MRGRSCSLRTARRWSGRSRDDRASQQEILVLILSFALLLANIDRLSPTSEPSRLEPLSIGLWILPRRTEHLLHFSLVRHQPGQPSNMDWRRRSTAQSRVSRNQQRTTARPWKARHMNRTPRRWPAEAEPRSPPHVRNMRFARSSQRRSEKSHCCVGRTRLFLRFESLELHPDGSLAYLPTSLRYSGLRGSTIFGLVLELMSGKTCAHQGVTRFETELESESGIHWTKRAVSKAHLQKIRAAEILRSIFACTGMDLVSRTYFEKTTRCLDLTGNATVSTSGIWRRGARRDGLGRRCSWVVLFGKERLFGKACAENTCSR